MFNYPGTTPQTIVNNNPRETSTYQQDTPAREAYTKCNQQPVHDNFSSQSSDHVRRPYKMNVDGYDNDNCAMPNNLKYQPAKIDKYPYYSHANHPYQHFKGDHMLYTNCTQSAVVAHAPATTTLVFQGHLTAVETTIQPWCTRPQGCSQSEIYDTVSGDAQTHSFNSYYQSPCCHEASAVCRCVGTTNKCDPRTSVNNKTAKTSTEKVKYVEPVSYEDSPYKYKSPPSEYSCQFGNASSAANGIVPHLPDLPTIGSFLDSPQYVQ